MMMLRILETMVNAELLNLPEIQSNANAKKKGYIKTQYRTSGKKRMDRLGPKTMAPEIAVTRVAVSVW